jgi:leukotriene-A4 hydrolase
VGSSIRSQHNANSNADAKSDSPTAVVDVHSFSNANQILVDHISLDLDVSFDKRIVSGAVILRIAHRSGDYIGPLILDTMDLNIDRVSVSSTGGHFESTSFSLGPRDPILGAALRIDVYLDTKLIRIDYSTSPGAEALQWLAPEQTAGKEYPFVYTQSESIYARSWIPLQDSPQVRITYDARIRTPRGMLALMSAENDPERPRTGDHTFRLTKPVPSYLIALAVGDLDFVSLGPRTGVYAEPALLKACAAEFEDLERMMEVAETLYGPYRWGRYDALVLPPSFPYGGMENPRLTFLTPTLLAGDKSLVAAVAHELAHSWAGNLVTNATWQDFWLNEGFSVYVERRLVEEVYGSHFAEMESALGFQRLQDELASLAPNDQIMHVELTGRSPDAGFTDIPYEKGALFLKLLEQTFGRQRFDQFLLEYFNHFAFQSITTDEFEACLLAELFDSKPELAQAVAVTEWLYEPGLPADAPRPASDVFSEVDRVAQQWMNGSLTPLEIGAGSWTTQEWLRFLTRLPEELGHHQMERLDDIYHLTQSENSEIVSQWFLMSVRNSYETAYDRMRRFLTSVGRIKFLKPLYREMAKTSHGKEMAVSIYKKARATYHPIAVSCIDEVLGFHRS